MNKIRIIADSTCDYDESLFQGMELEILPLIITVGNKSYLDREEIGVSEVYERIREGFVPKTAQIPYSRAYELFKACLDDGDDFIYIAFSSGMSGSYSLGHMVAEELRGEYPERKFEVIDSGGGSGATGLMALQALKMVRDGFSFEAVKTELEFMAGHVVHVFSVDDIEWLAKGGRIPKIIGQIGSKLGIHPILDVEDGRMVKRRMTRGHKSVIKIIADEIVQRAARFPAQLISITHSDGLNSAKELEENILRRLPGSKATICPIGGVVAAHIGLGGIGCFCFSQKSEHYCLV